MAKFIFIAIFFLFFNFKFLLAQDKKSILQESDLTDRRNFELFLKKLETEDPNVFADNYIQTQKEFRAYFEDKKKECLGKLSTFDLTEGREKKAAQSPLSKTEKSACFSALKTRHEKLLEVMIVNRRKIVTKILQQIEEQQKKSLNLELLELEKSYKSYITN